MNLMDVKGVHFPRPINYSPVLIPADTHVYHRPVTGTEPFPIDIKPVTVFRENTRKAWCAVFEFSEFVWREDMKDELLACCLRDAFDFCLCVHSYKICQHHCGIWVTVRPGIET